MELHALVAIQITYYPQIKVNAITENVLMALAFHYLINVFTLK